MVSIWFRNGSRFDGLASGQVSRGLAADIIVIDECELLMDDDLAALLPTKLATSAKQIFLGTTWSVMIAPAMIFAFEA
jgi:hypothetical protein